MNSGQLILPVFLPTDESTGGGVRTPNIEDTGECTGGGARTSSVEMEGSVAVRPVDIGRNPDLWLYRERTIALLRRYLRISIEVGRLPSLLGRELFRSKVTSYRMSSFEDAVIFVHDVERALDQLDSFGKDLVAVIIFQDYSQDEAAEVLHCARRTVCREFPEAVDKVSDLFLEGGLLNRLPPRRPVENSCQGGQNTQFSASPCK
jgi:hypothetical protein